MTKRHSYLSFKTLCHLFVMVGMLGAFTLQSIAQTAANTTINNVASATYSDGTTTYNTVSNPVVVTVAKVAGLTITPDIPAGDASAPKVVPGQSGVSYTFTVTNTGNFTNDILFKAGSLQITNGTVTGVTINGVAWTPTSDFTFDDLAAGSSIPVVVTYTASSSITDTDVVNITLGDTSTNGPTFDNVEVGGTSGNASSASEVRTTDATAVNGLREAKGYVNYDVEKDALPLITMTVPAGPVSLGSTISYTDIEACNVGVRALSPVSPDTQVYVYSAIPAGTALTNISALVAAYPGVQYTTTSLATAPLAATWVALTNATPATGITRIRIPVGTSIAAGTCASPVAFDVVVTTTNANTPISEIAEVYGSNSIGTTVFDQTGDNTPGTTGTPELTTLAKEGSVLNGPNGAPAASGPTNNNDDFTNKSVSTGIATVAPGGNTTAAGTVVFNNTVQNTGNADDTFTLTAPTVPTGFTVEISTDGGTTWVTVSGGGSTTVAVPFGASANYQTRITAPTGTPVLTGYDTVIRATSTIDPTKSNDTIDRLYTGFLRLDKSFVIDNTTGVGGATDAVPGATIIYTIQYTNISTTASGNNVGLTASNVVISEDGLAAPNNWGTFTTRVSAQEFDYTGASGTTTGTGTVVVVSATAYTDTVPSVAPQAIGRFVFKRTIN